MATRSFDVPQTVYSAEDRINEFFDHVVVSANKRRSALLAEVSEKRREMTSRMAPLSEIEQELLETKAEIERRMQNTRLGDLQRQILAEINEKLAQVQSKTVPVFQADYKKLEKLDELISGLGDVFTGDPQIIAHYRQLKPTKLGRNLGQLSFPRGVAIDTNTDHIYVAENGNERVSVFTESGEFINTFTHELMEQPWGIAINKDNMYVTDYGVNGVFHFKIHAGIHFITRLTGYGSADGQFNDPRQLTVSDNGDIFIVDCKNHRIQILDDALNFERSITHKSMHNPLEVQLTNTEVYVLSDNNSPCLHVFSHDGEKKRSFITQGRGMQVFDAKFFCLDAQENIIISDLEANSVKMFSPEGTLFHTIKNLIRPLSVALTRDMKLIVIDSNNKCNIFSC